MRRSSFRWSSVAALSTSVWLALAIAVPHAARGVTVPVEAATGPAFFQLDHPRFGAQPNDLAATQPWHFGLRLEIAAIIDREWAEEHPAYVPPQHRDRLEEVGEVRYAPPVLSLVPRSLIISPKFGSTGVYGATWEFLRIGARFGFDWAKIRLGAAAVATYAFVHSDILSTPFHFFRPGIDVDASLHIPVGETMGLSLGWSSNVYIPQAIGGGPFQFAGNRGILWHIGEAYALFHFQFPYESNL